MPKMMELVPNPDFKPETSAEKEAFERVKKAGKNKNGVVVVPYITALQGIQNAGGMYVMRPAEEPATTTAPEMSLDDMPSEQLKLMMLQLGVKTQKQMSRSQVIDVIRKKLSEIELTED